MASFPQKFYTTVENILLPFEDKTKNMPVIEF